MCDLLPRGSRRVHEYGGFSSFSGVFRRLSPLFAGSGSTDCVDACVSKPGKLLVAPLPVALPRTATAARFKIERFGPLDVRQFREMLIELSTSETEFPVKMGREHRQRQETTSHDKYAQGFCDFLNASPTIFHAVEYYALKLQRAGYKHLSERDDWSGVLKPGGKYFFTRNYSSMIAFTVGEKYVAGNGIALIGSHIDALTMRVKPVSTKSSVGYLQLGVAPYAGGGNMTWWDRDLGLAGRVMVSDGKGNIKQELLRMPYPVAKIPTLAPHFGAVSQGPFNKETQMTPIIGLERETVEQELEKQFNAATMGDSINDPTKNHSPQLLAAVARQLGIKVGDIKDFELELFDFQPAQPFGLDGDLLSVPRCDDKLCSYAAMEALLTYTSSSEHVASSGAISMVYLCDDEEVGSGLRQGAAGNMVPLTVERIVDVLNTSDRRTANLVAMTFARSFLISADVKHAVHPNVSA